MFTILDILFWAIPCAVIARLLLLQPVQYGFEGFFVFQNKFVEFLDNDVLWKQRLAWTDYIRQFLFNVYEINGNNWLLKYNRQGIVRCSFCLSFWVCILPSVLFVLTFSLSIFSFIPIYLVFVGISAILSDWM